MASINAPVDRSPSTFECLYEQAHGDLSQIPWNDDHPSPSLVAWLNVVAPGLIRCGARVAVVGCGLGYDAAELVRRGYDVTAFDCSETAVEWARQLNPDCRESFVHADLFSPPLRWRHRFDLVVEINTLQALHPSQRLAAAAAIADLMSPHGLLLAICRGSATPVSIENGPPWPLTEAELIEAAELAGLTATGPICGFLDDEDPPVLRMRAVFKRI